MSGRSLTVGLVAVSIAAAGGGAAYYFARRSPQAPVAVPSASIHPASPPAVPSPKLGCRFRVGDEAGFLVSSVVTARGTDDPDQAERFEGVLRTRVIDSPRTDEWLFGAAFVEAHLRQGLSSPDLRVTDPVDAPFLFRMNRECRFTAIGFNHAWKGAAKRFVSSTMRGAEAVAPADRRGFTYTASQNDALGAYTAVYDVQPPTFVGVPVRRHKTAYASGPAHSPLGTRVEVVASDTRAVFDPDGAWLRELDAHESIRLLSQGQTLADLAGVTQLKRDDSRGSMSWPPPGFALGDYVWDDPFEESGEPTTKPVDPRIAALSYEEALAELARLYANDGKPDSYHAALFLAEWLRAHPKMADAVMTTIRGGTLPDGQRSSAFLALEKCGTDEARSALEGGVRDKRLAALDRARAASALSDVPRPTRDTYRALLSEARSAPAGSDAGSRMVAATSLRALGHLGGRGAAVDDSIKTGVRTELARMLDAKNQDREVDVLDAIGNTGDEGLAARIASKLAPDESAMVREHAARAFRRMDPDSAREPLQNALATESDPAVRAAIADTLAQVTGGGRQATPSDITSAVTALSEETDPAARASLINLLGPAASTSPMAKQALVDEFRREKVASLQRLVGKYLSVADLR